MNLRDSKTNGFSATSDLKESRSSACSKEPPISMSGRPAWSAIFEIGGDVRHFASGGETGEVRAWVRSIPGGCVMKQRITE
jgi:hypothetical protein